MTERVSGLFSTTSPDPAGSPASTNVPAVLAKPARYYRPELDVLRCVAFLMVFTSHIPAIGPSQASFSILSTVEESGAAGVCVFFTLSAFLITELLLREKEDTGTIHRLAFLLRRILRIWPLYFLAVIVSIGGALVYHRWSAQPRFVIPYLLLSGNVATSFLGQYPRNGLLGPLWSISVEEQFYLFWPLLLFWKGRMGIKVAVALIFPVAWCIDYFVPLSGELSDPKLWTNSLNQYQYFALGALIALVLHRHPLHLLKWHRIGLLAGGGVCLTLAAFPFHFLFDTRPEHPVAILAGYLCNDAACALLLIGTLGAKLPSWANPFRYLGKISYGMYVFHYTIWIAFAAAATRILHLQLRPVMPELYLIVLGVTVALSTLSYRYFERPFLSLKERLTFVPSRAV